MKCPKCQFDNPHGSNFCLECGSKLELKCPKCDQTLPAGAKFCNACGHNLSLTFEPTPKDLSFDQKLEKIQRYLPKGLTEKILSQRDRIEGERKQVTVMFCDMEGFTSFSERIGPEEAYSIMDRVYEILIHKVHDYEGTVNEMTGDGIVALFGAPIALEDAPQRAIRSALAIHREMVKFSDKVRDESRALPIKMRIGIHTGPVVVGTLGNDLRVEFKAVGDTVNLAARMEEIAESGTIYVTEDTYRLTEGLFRFEGLGDRVIKGKDKPVKVYRVLAPSNSRTRFDVSSEQGLTPFVGRERELALLLDGYERAKEGRGQAFSIVAEAGLGKSRLLYEFRKAIANENVTFLEGKCLSYSRDVSYYPVTDILKTNFNIQDSDKDSEIEDKVKNNLRKFEDDAPAILPYILDLLSVKDSGIDKIALSPDAKRNRTLESLRKIVLKESERRPLITAVEDLHWIDKSSEESFRFLLESIAGAKVLLIFTYRPEFIHTWGGRSYHNQLNLIRLSNRESLSMIAHLLKTRELERELEELILDKTEGVPFFIEEFIKSFQDLKIIEKKDNLYCLTKELRGITIPSRIQDVIMARIDSLPENAKEALQAGVVIGREFSHQLIKEVSKLSEQALLSHLSILKESELLYERGIYPNSSYIIRHALTQDTVYQSLLKITRQKYHRLIAEVLEQHFSEITEQQPELMGHHYSEANLAKQAIPYWQQAGHRAIGRSTYNEAIVHIGKGIEAIETLQDTQERIKYELSLQTMLGHAFLATKGLGAAEAQQAFNRARELCQHIEETPEVFGVVLGLRRLYFGHAEHRKAKELGEQLLKLAHNFRNKTFLVEAYRLHGATLYCLGKLISAKAHFEQALSIYDPQDHRISAYLYGSDPAVSALCWLSLTLWELGYPDQALSSIRKALNLGQEVSHAYSISLALAFAPFLHQYCRETQITQERAEEGIAFSTEQKFPFWLARAKILRGWALVKQGQCQEGIAQILQGIASSREAGGRINEPYYFSMLAEGYEIRSQLNEGLTVLKDALSIVEKTGESYWEAELIRQKGELLLAQSQENLGEAEFCYKKAIKVAQRQKAKSLELRAAMSLSRLWQGQDKVEEARNLLSEIYGWFTEGFDTADLKDSKALLDELS